MQKGFQNNMNLDHTKTSAGSFIFQSYITDAAMGLNAPKGLESLPDGTWIVGSKVTDKTVWNSIKSGERNGFSVEGVFEFFQPDKSKNDVADAEVMELLNSLNKMLDNKIKSKK